MNIATQQNSLKKDNKIIQFKNKITSLLTPKARGLRESIEDILDEKRDDSENLAAGEKAIFRNVLEFKELYVEDVMVPRVDIFAIQENVSIDDLKEKLLEKSFTRIPVYKGDLDEIVGFIHIKDIAKLLFSDKNLDIKSITRKCLFVPGPMKISNLLIRMQKSKVHIAIVVDEYGGTEGIITLEDIIEEIVGKIDDEHDAELETQVKKTNDNEFEVNPRISIDDFRSVSEIDLTNLYDDEEYDTIGGLVYLIAGRIPVRGEIVRVNENIEIEVAEADARTLQKVVIRRRPLT